MKSFDRGRALAIALALLATPAIAGFVEVDEAPARSIEWDEAPAALKDSLLAYRKANAHCHQADAPIWAGHNKTINVHDLKGGARVLFQVCGLAGGARVVSYIVMIARGKDDATARPAALKYQTGAKGRFATTGDIANPSIDAAAGRLSANDPLDARGEYCQRRHEWKWNGKEFSLAAIREWKKCDDAWPGEDKGRPMPLVWPGRR